MSEDLLLKQRAFILLKKNARESAPVFTLLKKRYCRRVIDKCNLFVKTRNKMYNLTLSNELLMNCRKYKVTPKWLGARIRRSKLKHTLSVEEVFIKNELGRNECQMENLRRNYDRMLEQLQNLLSFCDFIALMKFVSATNKRLVKRRKRANDTNLSFLKSKRFGSTAKRHIINLSSYQPTDEENYTLSLGLNFALPPINVNRDEVLTSFEMFYHHIKQHKPVDKVNEMAFKAKLLSYAHGYGQDFRDDDFNLCAKDIRKSVKTLRNQQGLIITKPDKGSGVVLMDRTDYVAKMHKIIDDTTKFEHLGPIDTHDKTEKRENDLKKFLKTLYWKEDNNTKTDGAKCNNKKRKNSKQNNKNRNTLQLSENEYNFIRPVGSQRPRLYGLPKTHKTGTPLRPILSLVGSAEHNLAKFLNSILEPVTTRFSKFTIKDSFTFADKIRRTPAENTYMVSFDVKSLFTNVPLTETINICAEALYQDHNIKLQRSSFIKLMHMATSSIEFSFNGEMFRQKDGVAMGSPLGPTLANIIMGYLEENYFRSNQNPLVYYRYVDDCFILFNNKEECDEMFTSFNRLHPSIKFTQETEVNNTLPFLDVLVERRNGEFVTSVYRKNTFTGQYVNFQSYCTQKRKVNLIRTLCDRAIKICSTTELDAEVNKISTILQENGFPEHLVKSTIKRRMQNEPPAETPTFGPDLQTISIKLPFLGKTSHRMEAEVNKLVRRCYNSARARAIFTSSVNFSPANKDHIPMLNKSAVIYRFECHCGNDYVGKTSRRFVDRIKEHVPPCVKNFIRDPFDNYLQETTLCNASKKSSVAKHLLENFDTCGKKYSVDKFRILRN